MGQLEKYGLYVLCLVIFLILGVTIWGGGELPQPPRRTTPGSSSELNANPRGPAANVSNVAGNVAGNSGSSRTNSPAPYADINTLLNQVAPPERRNEVKPIDAAGPGKASQDPKVAADATKPPAKPAVPDAGKPPADAARPTYKVQQGDTFDSIAKEKLGSASLRTEIARLNPRVDPSKLQINEQLQLPTVAEIAALTAKTKAKGAPDAGNVVVKKSAEPGSYTVAKGDTFEAIARRELGSSKRVNELRELNSELDPTKLRAGMTIRLPKK